MNQVGSEGKALELSLSNVKVLLLPCLSFIYVLQLAGTHDP